MAYRYCCHSRIAKAIHQRLLSVLKVLRVGKLRGVKHNLVHDLRNSDGMCARALIVCERAVAGRICYMALVVWAVEIDAVPARREDDGSANAPWT
jgi:hypothetical protein